MLGWYAVVKFVHVASVIVWVGGLTSMAVLNAMLARAGDGEGFRVLGRHGAGIGRTVLRPAAGLALLSGVTLALLLHTFTFWMGWGLVALVGTGAFGGRVVRPAVREFASLAAMSAPDLERLDQARRRVVLLNGLMVALLLSAVFAMVTKPTI